MDVERTTSPDLDIESLVGQNSIVIGAPYVGKTHQFDETPIRHTRVERLEAAFETPEDEFVVIDEFYTAYQRATADAQRTFGSWLDREGGVCLVTRPREIDWLLESDDSPLAERVLDAFEAAYLLRYRPDDESDKTQAVADCLSIATQDADASLDESDVRSAMDDLMRTEPYSFDNATLAERLGIESYDETLVPALVIYVSDQLADGSGAISSSGVTNVCGGVGENFGVSQFITETKDACAGLFSKETLTELWNDPSQIGSAATELGSEIASLADSPGATVSVASALGLAGGAVPSAVVAGGSLALYVALRDDVDDIAQEGVFDALLGEELTPPAQAQLEAELGVPPRTIANFQRLVRGGTVEQLIEDSERLDTELGDVQRRLNEVCDTVEEYDQEWETLAEMLTTLEETAIDHVDLVKFVAGSITEATRDMAAFRRTVRSEEEQNVLQDSVKEVPPYFGDEDRRIFEAITSGEADLILLRGSHGVGKTTAAYRACDVLSQHGYDVRLPNFDGSSPEALRYALTATDDQTVVFASYKRGAGGGNTARDIGDVRQLVHWLNAGYCSTVVLECREELYWSLDSEFKTLENPDLKSFWRPETEIEFEGLSGSNIARVGEWALDQLNFDGDRESIVRETVRLADGNPEIAKIAARFAAIADDGSLANIGSADKLIWRDIDYFFGTDPEAPGGDVFEYTSAIRRIQTSELGTILDLEIDDLEERAESLSGYLAGDVLDAIEGTDTESTEERSRFLEPDTDDEQQGLNGDEIWTVSPDIYAEIVFRSGCFQEKIPRRTFGDYLSAVSDLASEERYMGLAENLGQAYIHAINHDDVDQDEVASTCHKLLSEVGAPGVYARCLDDLVRSGVPVAPWHLEENLSRLIEGIDQEHEQLVGGTELDEPSIAINRFAYLYRNHLEFGSTDQLSNLSNILGQAANKYSDTHDLPPGQFLANVYAVALWSLTQWNLEPAAVSDWIDAIEARAQTAADADTHDEPPSQFLANVYALALSSLADMHPEPTAVSDWIDAIEARAQTAADADTHDAPPDQFLANVYSMAMRNLDRSHPEPAAVRDWIDAIETRAQTAADADTHEKTPGQFLAKVYVTALLGPADMNPEPAAVSDWIDAIETRAQTAADADTHDVSPGQFLENFYALALSSLAQWYPEPAVVSDWIDAIEGRAQTAADADTHDTDSGRFFSMTLSMTLGQVIQKPQSTAQQWYPFLVERFVETVDIDLLPQLCKDRESIHSQDDRNLPAMHVRFVTVVLSAAVREEDPLGSDYEDRVTRVASVIAAIVDQLWVETGLDEEYFEAIVSATADLEEDHPELHADLVKRVPERLDETHDNLIAGLDWEQALD